MKVMQHLVGLMALSLAASAMAQQINAPSTLPITPVSNLATEHARPSLLPPVETVNESSAPAAPPTPAVPAELAKSPVKDAATPRVREVASDISGSVDSSRVRLTVEPGVTDLVPIARNYMNHIETPFNDPKLITVSKLDFRKEGRSIYVATSSDKPVGVEIRSNDPDDSRSISLALVPRAIPPRTISLQFEGETGAIARPLSYSRAERWEKSSTYEETLIDLATKTARGVIPDGYSLTIGNVDQMNCKMPNVTFTTGQRLTGTHFSMFVLRAHNTSAATMEIVQDAGCDVPGLLFVAPYPEAFLAPGGDTELLVIVSNESFQAEHPSNARPSLLGR